MVGGIAALWLRGMNLNLSALIGFIALFGVAMLNGVVLVSSINQLRLQGEKAYDAVVNGARRRLRPVLMTACVASFGFLPMALSTSTGAEVQRPLASVVIGGLVTSTALTLFLLPVLYEWVFEKAQLSPSPNRLGWISTFRCGRHRQLAKSASRCVTEVSRRKLKLPGVRKTERLRTPRHAGCGGPE